MLYNLATTAAFLLFLLLLFCKHFFYSQLADHLFGNEILKKNLDFAINK